MKQHWRRHAVIVLFAFAAIVSLCQGLHNAFRYSNDLQWSGVVLLHDRIDPYQVYLDGDPAHQLMRWQIPNYLHELYLVEFPLGWFDFQSASRIWAFVNLAFFAVVLRILVRFYELRAPHRWLFCFAAIASTGFRNSLGNGQQSIFALLAFVLSVCTAYFSSETAGLASLYAKYNFAPAILGFFLAKRKLRVIAVSLVPPAIGYLLFLWRVHGQHPIHLLIEPFLVSRTGITPGKADLMSLVEFTSPRMPTVVPYALGLAAAIAYGWFAATVGLSRQAAASSLAAATLIVVKHVEYDLVLLIIPLAYFVARRNAASLCALGILGYLFYVDRWLPLTSLVSIQWARLTYFMLIATLIGAIHRTDRLAAASMNA